MKRLVRKLMRPLRRRMYARRVATLCAQRDRTLTEIREARKHHRPTAHLWERQRQTCHQIMRLTR